VDVHRTFDHVARLSARHHVESRLHHLVAEQRAAEQPSSRAAEQPRIAARAAAGCRIDEHLHQP
jgi:hypothetical protein